MSVGHFDAFSAPGVQGHQSAKMNLICGTSVEHGVERVWNARQMLLWIFALLLGFYLWIFRQAGVVGQAWAGGRGQAGVGKNLSCGASYDQAPDKRLIH